MITQSKQAQHKTTENIARACGKIPPLWPLSNFVAVNPFVGFSDQSFAQTVALHQRIHGADTLMPKQWYKEKYESGEIGFEDIRAAVTTASDEIREPFVTANESFTLDHVIELLDQKIENDIPAFQPRPFSGFLDEREKTNWQHFIREETAKWCAAYFDQGQASWTLPWKTDSLYEAWKQAVAFDRNPEHSGLKHFRKMASQLPATPNEAIEIALQQLEISEPQTEEFLYQILLIVSGWAGHLSYYDREKALRGEQGNLLTQLLAIILNYEIVLFHHFEGDTDRTLAWKRTLMEDPTDTGEPLLSLELAQQLLWQNSFEHALEQKVKASIQPRLSKKGKQSTRPDVQAAFCIDVRSEVFRRSLEEIHPGVKTIGFAGFFGIAIEHHHPEQEATQARCPVLLAPQIKTCEHSEKDTTIDKREMQRSWKQFREAAASSFSFVETLGLSYAYKLIKDALAIQTKPAATRPNAPKIIDNLSPSQKADKAESILRGLNLTQNLARLVLLCGHGGKTKNNPYASGLDCGACGGHAGDANARVAASLLNDPEVKALLNDRGLPLPKDTHFIAGMHNTTTDEVTLFDLEQTPAELMSEALALQATLQAAGKKAALERAPQLDGNDNPIKSIQQIKNRSCDWSQIRPEWGLAGNTAFIIAPRDWTQAANLEGRAFLHEYQAENDPQATLLEAIIGGPLVVGSWINLQYYGSAVDNAHFGSGHKAIHNIVGGVGVALGNENDLRPGLPFQSVHDGEELRHEPARLLVCIAAEPETIEDILSRNQHVNDLVTNNWIHVIALGAEGNRWARRTAKGQWTKGRQTAFKS